MWFTDGSSHSVVDVPCGTYDCSSARDRLHTLRRTDDEFGIVGTRYVTNYTTAGPTDDSLVGGNGLFHESYAAFVPRYAARMIRMTEVEHELRMQIERVLGTGLDVTHLNGHQHLHLLPRIFDLVHLMAEEYGVGYVRTVSEPRRMPDVSPLRRASVAMLSALGRRARRHCAFVTTNDRTIGVLQAGRIGNVEPLLDEVEGVTELVCHPGLGDAELGEAYQWGYAWDAETAALCSPSLPAAMKKRHIRLVGPSEAARYNAHPL